MATAPATPLELELVPLLVLGGRTAASLDLVLEDATGVDIAVEPVAMPVDRAIHVGLEVASMPRGQAAPVWELADEVPVVPGADGFALNSPLDPEACCLRLVARVDGDDTEGTAARALVRAKWLVAGNGEVQARASVRLNGWTFPMQPWPRLDLRVPPPPEQAPAFGGSLAAALHRLSAARQQ